MNNFLYPIQKIEIDYRCPKLRDFINAYKLSEHLYLYLHEQSPIQNYTLKTKEKDKKFGHVLRTGDVIKFGRISMIIRESSVDVKNL